MSIDVTPLRRAGLTIDGDEFVRRVMAAAAHILPARPIQDTRADLSDDEVAFLREAGVDLSAFTPVEHSDDSPLTRTAEEYAALLATSLSIPEMAARLGVDASRLRHRLADHTLFGIRDGRVWRLPQFLLDDTGQRLVPGIEQVAPTWRGIHPIAVRRWFEGPSEDLQDESGRTLSPRSWLLTGRDPRVIAGLAEQEMLADG
jgi:hypothetical protein